MNTFDSRRSSLIDYDDSLESNPFVDTVSQRNSALFEPSSPFSQQPIATTATDNSEFDTDQLYAKDDNVRIEEENTRDNLSNEEPLPTEMDTANFTSRIDELSLDSHSQKEQQEHYQHPEEIETDTQVSPFLLFLPT